MLDENPKELITEPGVTTIAEFPIPRAVLIAVEKMLLDNIADGTWADARDDENVKHFFIPGGYGRQLLMPKNLLMVGALHRYPCFNYLLRGRVTVFSELGRMDIVAPYFFVSQPGAKRVFFVHEEALWMTVHGTHETDVDKIEAELIVPSYAALDRELQNKELAP